MKIAITIATYQRPDGKSYDYLTRALNSIKNQSHQDFKVFLIGDKYEDNDEFESIAKSALDPDKIYFENLPVAMERSIYTGRHLWSCGGVNAMNTGISRALENGFSWVAHLDHDDYWAEDHLSSVSKVVNFHPDANFIFTASTHRGFKHVLPKGSALDGNIYNKRPLNSNAIHSSFSFNAAQIKLRYRDCLKETGESLAADADFLNRINKLIYFNPYFFNKVTCFQPQEMT
jgi:glycosyltransferase involved in cell wall biosynthesis